TNEEQINIITQYNSMINTLSNDQHFQLTLVVSKIYEQEYRLQNEFPLQKDKYDYLRKELNEMIMTNYQKGLNNYQIDRYITIATKAENKVKALGKLENTHTLMANTLASIEVPIKSLSGLDRLR
ncbi:hypothetical protein ACPTGY_13915, partial [Enterococcus faecalis]